MPKKRVGGTRSAAQKAAQLKASKVSAMKRRIPQTKAQSGRKTSWPAHMTWWANQKPSEFENERAVRRGMISIMEYQIAGGTKRFKRK